MLQNDPQIIMKARELIDAHGANAESVALQLMTQSMQTDEVEETTFWLSVIHEIRQLATSAGLVN